VDLETKDISQVKEIEHQNQSEIELVISYWRLLLS